MGINRPQIVPILHGVPVTSNRGALGWSSSSVIMTQGRTILFDTGSYGDRDLFLHTLAEHGLGLDSFDLIAFSHFHFDHMVNAELFTGLEFHLSGPELDYILSGRFQEAKDPYVPLAHIDFFRSRLRPVEDEDEIAPGVHAIALPGHTPGSMGLWVRDLDLVLTADAVKNRSDYVHGTLPPCFGSPEDAKSSMRRITSLASTIIPGHDTPFSVTQTGTQPIAPASDVELSVSRDPDSQAKRLVI